MRHSTCETRGTKGGRCSFCYAYTCGEDLGKYKPQVQLPSYAALEKHDTTDKAREFTVSRHGGAVVTLHCSGSLMVSEIISRLAPDSAAMVYHGARLLRNDIRIDTLDLDAGCSSLEIHEWLGGGGGGCSRIRPEDDVSALGDSVVSANAHGLNRTTVQHTALSRIIDEQKIELETLQREKREQAAASAKEISSLRLQVVALETQLGQAANETCSRAGEAGFSLLLCKRVYYKGHHLSVISLRVPSAEGKTRIPAVGTSDHAGSSIIVIFSYELLLTSCGADFEDGGNLKHECLDSGGGHERKDAANQGNADGTTSFNADKMNTPAELQALAHLSPLEETTADVSERQGGC